jgi:hypothetical protein
LRAAEISSQQHALEAALTENSPLHKYRQLIEQQGVDSRPPPVQLDTTMYVSSPLKDFAAEVKRDLVYNLRPMLQLPEPVSTVHTPPYSRGTYTMHSDPGLRLTVDLGPILWMHAERGAPGIGQVLSEVA